MNSDVTKTGSGKALQRGGQAMSSDSVTGPYAWVARTLCVVVLIIIVAAMLYAAWIGITNYSRIAV
jgi:hypothetical protein